MRKIPGLDFLRGISILLVMTYHFEFTTLITRAGWAGVDMFFVLSGFLVSGLLLNEYKQTGKIRPLYFLIRRGFKIYPLFYFAVLLHILYYFIKGIAITKSQILAEVFFFQNYSPGLIGISWSLAVEEHFYILLAILLFVAYKKNIINRGIVIPVSIFFICFVCFFLHIYAYNQGIYILYKNYFPTQLWVDSLAFGVLLSYWSIYHKEKFYSFFRKYILLLLVIAILFILPIFIWSRETFIVNVMGHTSLYIGFGIIMASMIIFSKEISSFLRKYYLTYIFNLIAWIGAYSFGIYLFHLKAGWIVSNWVRTHLDSDLPRVIYFFIYIVANICAGVFFSKLIEHPFLKIREKYFPRISAPIAIGNQPGMVKG